MTMDAIKLIKSTEEAFYGTGASEDDIKNAQERLRLQFSDDYIEYLKLYGAAMVNGHSLTGISNSKQLDVVENTLREKKIDNRISDDLYVIENTTMDGIIIWQTKNRMIYESSFTGIRIICKSLSDYLENYVLSKR